MLLHVTSYSPTLTVDVTELRQVGHHILKAFPSPIIPKIKKSER